MLEALKREFRQYLIDREIEVLFGRVREELAEGKDVYKQFEIQQTRWNALQRESMEGILDEKDEIRRSNEIDKALFALIGQIQLVDLNAYAQEQAAQHVAVPHKHIYACNRSEQNNAFTEFYYDPPEEFLEVKKEKIYFFYLEGDVRQVQEGLFLRLGMELGGFLENWKKGDYDPGIRIKFVDYKPRTNRNPKVFQINVYKGLFAHFFEPLNRQQPLLKKNISDLLQSPDLQGFGPADMVFILLKLDDYNWDRRITPQVVRKLYEDFCNCEMHEDAPAFFFFFGIEYEKDNAEVKKEVHEALQNAQYGKALPLLQQVTHDDIADWLNQYDVLIPMYTTPMEMARALFPDTDKMDMADVIPVLTQLVNDHNKGHVSTPK